MSTNGSQPLLEVEDLVASYPVGRGVVGAGTPAPPPAVPAVDGGSVYHLGRPLGRHAGAQDPGLARGRVPLTPVQQVLDGGGAHHQLDHVHGHAPG